MDRTVIQLIEAEYHRYRVLAECALGQLEPAQLLTGSGHDNSIATIVWHIAGNLESRFTDFLTTDGEKPVAMRVDEALLRSLAHVAYHVGQIVYLAKSFCGDEWESLSIPPGQSEAYNANPVREKSSMYAETLGRDRQ